MFANQSKKFEELRKYLPDEAVDILREIFTNEESDQEHHGNVTIGPRPIQVADENRNFLIAKGAVGRIRGQMWGTVRWAKTIQAWTSDTVRGKTQYWVVARDCDPDGATMTGGRFDLRLVCTGGHRPVLDVGDVLCYEHDVEGTPVAIPNCEAVPVVYSTPPDILVRLA